MSTQPVISVRGEAIMEVEPEIAIISVTVQASDRDRRTVLDRVAARHAQMLTLVKGYGEAVEKVASGTASIYPDPKNKGRDERVNRHLARANTRITIRDFTVLGELVTRVADGDMVTVAGPWWSLRPDSQVYRQARIAAAREATRRAEEYAEAFNGRLGELIQAADIGLLTDSPQLPGQVGPTATATALAVAGTIGPSVLDFEPAKQTVRAQLDARFYMLPGQAQAG